MISKEDVKRIAKLARLGLTQEEILKFQKDLSSVLDYIEKLKEADVSRVKPTAHSIEMENVMRDEEESSKFKNRASITELPKGVKVRKRMKFSFDYGSEGEEESGDLFAFQSSKLLEAMPETKDGYLKTKPIL